MDWLEQLLASVQFLSTYPLAFIQRIEVRRRPRATRHFSHHIIQMVGCFTIFDAQRLEAAYDLPHERVVLLAPSASEDSLVLDPFLTVADQIPVPGVCDVFVLNGVESRRARYLSAHLGQELPTDHPAWPHGPMQLEDVRRFFDLLRHAPIDEVEVEITWEGQTPSAAVEEHSTLSTEEIFAAQYQRQPVTKPPSSPYKFLDYFNPEDAALFFGRDQEIHQVQRKFHTSRLLILHGESGTGKTSLIRAGLIPRLSPETWPLAWKIMPPWVKCVRRWRAIWRQLYGSLGGNSRRPGQCSRRWQPGRGPNAPHFLRR
jgi:hypothetical protein